MLNRILTIIHIFSAFGIIALVLVQRGRGAEAGAGFGAGASGTVFGARGARTALSRTTAILAAVFMLTSLALAYMGNRQTGQTQSVLDKLVAPATTSSTPASAPAAGQSPVLPANGATPPAGGTAPATTPHK